VQNQAPANKLIERINDVFSDKTDSTVNIVNDKLTLSVFSLLRDNLSNGREINFIIRDTRFLPEANEIAREFEINANPKDMLFNQYDIVEKNKLSHYSTAKAMYEFIKQNVNVRITRPPHSITDSSIEPKTFIRREMKKAEKERIQSNLFSIRLIWQIAGEDIPSTIDEDYNCTVTMGLEIKLKQ